MRRPIVWLLTACVSITCTVVSFFPTTWLAVILEKQTAGRFSLSEAQGSIWHGSAVIVAAASAKDPVTPLLPGRFSWHLSPLLLLGQVQLKLENQAALSQPISVTGNWQHWQLSAGAMQLPAERLVGLGAPLNTIAPSGAMRLSWGELDLSRQNRAIDVQGWSKLEMHGIASRLSSIKPLGDYQLHFDFQGQQARVTLQTTGGPLLLSGSGVLQNGHLQFDGKAEVGKIAAQLRPALENLMNLLGQRRNEGDKTVIALEFK